MKKIYSEEFKKDIINQCLAGTSVAAISKKYGIARSTLYIWLKSHTSQSAETISKRDHFRLKQKCDQQEKAIEILCLAFNVESIPLADRYNFIKDLSDQYSISLLCKTLKVAKGSYFNHILRNKNENTLAAQKRAELTPVIEKIFHESNEIYGSGKIHAILKDRGYKVSQDTVADIMHKNGWFAIGTGAKKLYLMNQERKENILNQQFNVCRPNEVWVSDVTYFRYNERNYYICVIIDLYARKVVGYKISLSNSTQLTKATFKLAFEFRQPTDLLFHSDQGSNYTSNTFVEYLRYCNIRQSFSRKSVPYDNSVMESFFKSMKTEKLYRTNFRSEREIKMAVKDYINYYNTNRPHSMLNYQTPNAYENKYFSKQQKQQC